jgi:hypothetical protein
MSGMVMAVHHHGKRPAADMTQRSAARGGILDKFPPPQSQLKPLVRAARQCEGDSRGGSVMDIGVVRL